MKMFEKLREKLIPKNQNSRAYRMQFARSLHGKSIRYVTERDENAKEHVIGHRGSVSLRDGDLLVFSDGEIIFRADAKAVLYSPLMSLDGVILSGPDRITGKERTVVVYYLYYRK